MTNSTQSERLEAPLSVGGEWNISYKWDSDKAYSNTVVTFKADGTFTAPIGNGFDNGVWALTDASLIWLYEGERCIYAGVVAGDAVSGGMVNFDGGASGSHIVGTFYGAASDVEGAVDDKVATARDSAGRTIQRH